MKKTFLLLLLIGFLSACGTSRTTAKSASSIKKESAKRHKNIIEPAISDVAIIPGNALPEDIKAKDVLDNVVDYAKTFEGTKYKYGGTTEAGMDCSGLVYTSFMKEKITLPRISRDMAKEGVLVSLKDIKEGDLIFFKTSRKHAINHVGIVVDNKRGDITFIHSSTSAGVIVSSLEEAYWKNAFVECRRII